MQLQKPTSSLSKLTKVIKHQWVLITSVFVVVVSVSLIVTFLQKTNYIAEGKLSFRRTATTLTLTGLGKEVSDLSNLSTLREQTSPVDTEIEIIRSQPLINTTITSLNLKDVKGNTVQLKDFMKRLKITAIKGTDVIQLTYEDRDATIAAAVINSIMNIYLEENVKNYRFITSNARKFVKKQIPLAEQKVEKTEMDLRQFRELNKIVSLEEEQKDSVQFLLALKNQFNTVLTQLSDTEAQLKVIQNQLGIDPEKSIDTTKANQSKGVQDLLTEKQSLEAQLANESTRYQDSHPVLQSLRSRIAALDGLLRERIAAVTQRSPADTSNIQQIGALQQDLTSQSIQLNAKRDGFASQLQTILDSEEQYKQRVNSLPKLEQQQRQLSRYLDVAQSTYTLLLKKEEELRITEDQITGNAQIISPAIVPQELGESIRVPLILGSLILGAALGLALGYVLDSADKSLRTIEDVISAYSFPLLGEILIEENHQVMAIADENNLSPINWDKTEKEQKFVIRDAAQLLGLNLKVLNLKKSIKVIVVTSVEAKEGKSTIAAYLGASLAQLGEKVLLIDANLHSPSQHHLWNYDNHSGLSDILVNSVDADLAVVKSMPNLSLISSGTVNVSHPLAILDTLKMDSVIRNLSSQYDYVILDTPAIRSSPDALFLSKFTDGMLLVVRPNISTIDSAAYLKESLEQSGQTVFAQVVNGVQLKVKVDLQNSALHNEV